jgi:hypothetical protein
MDFDTLILRGPHQRLQPAQRPRLEAVTDARAVDLAADEPASFSTLRCCDTVDWASGSSATMSPHTQARAMRQEAQDLHPRGVTERLGQRGQLLVGLRALDRTEVGTSLGRGATRLLIHRGNTI